MYIESPKFVLSDVIKFTSQMNMKHGVNGCNDCDKVANHYMTVLNYIKQHSYGSTIQCNSDLFELIWHITHLILSHRETNTYQNLPWFNLLSSDLWEFAKQLKEESYESDVHIPIKSNAFIYEIDEDTEYYEEIQYRRAIRITIYSCRALIAEEYHDFNQAFIYYRKCASVRPTQFEHQDYLQQSALAAICRLKADLDYLISSNSCRSQSSSNASSLQSEKSCANCGIEKPVMPICSRCKSQFYCSARCLKLHHPIHSQTCFRQHSS